MDSDFQMRVRDAIVHACGGTRAAAADFARREMTPELEQGFRDMFAQTDQAVKEAIATARAAAAPPAAVDEVPPVA